jgi:hypothetical protein
MSMRKSPTLISARLDANRHNAQKSRGPRTARGTAQARMNSLPGPLSCGMGQGGSRTAPTCTRVNCGVGGARPRPKPVRPNGGQKEFLFRTFEAGMLLKTNEA